MPSCAIGKHACHSTCVPSCTQALTIPLSAWSLHFQQDHVCIISHWHLSSFSCGNPSSFQLHTLESPSFLPAVLHCTSFGDCTSQPWFQVLCQVETFGFWCQGQGLQLLEDSMRATLSQASPNCWYRGPHPYYLVASHSAQSGPENRVRALLSPSALVAFKTNG